MVKRTMNGKRLLILAAFAAFASFAMPAAFATSIANQTNITIKWNTQAVGSMALHTNYNASGAFGGATAAVVQNLNGGTTGGGCTLAPAAQSDLTVDFSNVTADGTKFTDCQYKNGFNVDIITSDPGGYTFGYQATAAIPAGYGICAQHNGTWAAGGAVVQSVAATAVSIQAAPACASGDRMDSTGTPSAFAPTTATAPTNLGADIELVIPNNASVGAASVTELFTLTLN
jgi:hypothetical protein